MRKHHKRHTPWRALSYPLTVLATIGLSAPLQADALLTSGQPGAKYGAIAKNICNEKRLLSAPDSCGRAYSNSHTSQEEANQQALKKCGVSDCKVVAELTNVCGAVAYVSDTWKYQGKPLGYAWTAWSEQADGEGLKSLSDLEKTLLDYCNSTAQQYAGQKPGYTFKPCSLVASSCPPPFLSLSPSKETFNCGETVTINVSPIVGKWIPVINGIETPLRSLQSSLGPFKGCNTSWHFYLRHPNEGSTQSNTVKMTWKASN